MDKILTHHRRLNQPQVQAYRVPSREELFHMVKFVDRKIVPLNHALDDMQAEIKRISDRLKKLEEAKK